MGEGGRIGKAAAVEGIVGIHVQRLHRQHVLRQFHALHAVRVVPAREVMCILVDDVEPEALAVVEMRLSFRRAFSLFKHRDTKKKLNTGKDVRFLDIF